MQILAFVLVLLMTGPLRATNEPRAEAIRGLGFDGVIFSPTQVHDDISPGFGDQLMWRPTHAAVRAAEKALPAAVAAWTHISAASKGLNFPTSASSKSGTNLHFSPAWHDTRPDSVVVHHDFLNVVEPKLSHFKRQYIGLYAEGQRVLYLNFIFAGIIDFDPSVRKAWRQHWVEVLDGGDNFWSVIYNPRTGKFSDWSSNSDG